MMTDTRYSNRCDYCGVRNLLDAEIVPGWYIAGVFTPMGGGQYAHCLDCLSNKPRPYTEPDEALYAIIEPIRKHAAGISQE